MRHITPEILLKAYALGVFPMAESRHDPTLYWVDPEERGVLPLENFYVPHKIRSLVRRDQFTVKVNTAFRDVVNGCAEPTPARPSTWINDTVIDLYEQLFRMGRAQSVECWQAGKLVGGLYGVSLGAAFFGESMFSRAPSASQVALVHLVARLIGGGFRLLDTQFTTEHLKRFGVINISREDYHHRLSEALREMGNFDAMPETITGAAAMRIIASASALGAMSDFPPHKSADRSTSTDSSDN